MAAVGALARLATARARRRPAGWLLSVAGIALTLGYAGGVVVASTITADRSARTVLSSLPASDRAVRLTWQGLVTPRVRGQALALLRHLGLPPPVEVVLMNGVRLGGTVVRPAGITPLAPWLGSRGIAATSRATAAGLGSCTARACPVALVSPNGPTQGAHLTAPGVHLAVDGRGTLRSALPLGFVPQGGSATGSPLLLTGDARGLDALPGLAAFYRTDSWVTPLAISSVHAWQLGPLARRLRSAQPQLLASNSGFSMVAPFSALDAARSEAAAPRRLWLAGGGAAAALIMFIVLAAGALRREQAFELDRLRTAGARRG